MAGPALRALIVEDDPSWQQILGEILTDMELEVDAAGNLETALCTLKTEAHRIAVVDLSLVNADHLNTDGLKVLGAIKASDPECRTILLTGFATVDVAVSVLTEYGAFSFLRKENFKRSNFRDLVKRALANTPAPEKQGANKIDPDAPDTLEAGNRQDSSGNTVIVVEDDAGWRSILSELAAESGSEVRPCVSFGDALGCLRREKFQLAVVDLSFKDSSHQDHPAVGASHHLSQNPPEGYQLLAEMKAASIPTIVVSGIASMEEIQRIYSEYSIFAFLEKQAFNRSTFQRLVTEALISSKEISELDILTVREREVFDLVAKGMTNKEIAGALVITQNTVKRHLKSIFEKLNVHTRSAAVSKAVTNPPQS
jgi:RNA polymerase sigma factor (sigma-70 family)